MLLKCYIWTIIVASTVADWIQLPVMAPHEHIHNIDKYQMSSPLEHRSTEGQINNPHVTTSILRPYVQKNNAVNPKSHLSHPIPSIESNSLSRPSHSESKFHFLNSSINNKLLNTSMPKYAEKTISSKNKSSDTEFVTDSSTLQKHFIMDSEEMNTTESKTAFNDLPIEVLNTVHQTLSQKTPDTIQGKMQFLQQLKEKLSTYIELRIKKLWAVDDRQARMDKGMAFPSMEGALMTICFLLFAVFLVKLVQQLIQSLQNSATTTGTTTMVMAGVAGNTGRRRRRSIPDILETARILQLMEEFQIQHIQKEF